VLVVRVLGPVEVTVGAAKVDLGGTLPRRLLVALAAAEGQVVPDDRLAELVWGQQQPAKVSAALQVYVSRLRRALGPDGRDAVEREGIGYRLRAELDATTFTNAVAEARKLSDPADVMRGLAEALKLWRGEPYADLDEIDAPRMKLKELREVALEECAAARVASGDAVGAVPDLEELVRAAPLRERRWALLMLALYRGGRQGDALATVRRARQVLADELGVDPGDELQDLERQVLAHDPRLTVPEPMRAQPSGRPLTSFLGREAELSTIEEQLAGQRLVSLIGPAGVGKTRLAVQYAGKAWFARLADVRQPGELPSVVADAVGLVAVQDDPTTATIRTIGARSALLVLDNCEHVVEAAAELAMTLIARCPQLKILATSREPLGVDGEVTVVIDPLPLATADALLVDRVQAVRPGWNPSPSELADARRISTALDGLPLAIELAAARARMFGLSEIAERLDDRFALLGQVPRGSLAVHATLEAAIGWSVDLLSEEDRALLLRLWPFEGGFTLEAAEAVCPVDGQALESLSSLVTRSVVVADTTLMPTRYLLLESVRAYCQSIDPDPAATLQAHAEWVHELGRRCLDAVRGKRADWYLRVLGRELPNIRAGLKHDLEHAPGDALRTLGMLGLLFTRTVHKIEAATLARDVLAAAKDATPFQRARGMVVLLALTAIGGDRAAAGRLLADAFEVAKGIDDGEDPLDVSELYYHLAFCSVEIADVPNTLLATARAIEFGIPSIVRAAETVRAAAHVVQAHTERDIPAMLDAARVTQRLGRGFTAGWSSLVFAEANLGVPDGDAVEALEAVRHALGVFDREQDIPNAIGAFYFAAVAFARTSRPYDAIRLLAAVHERADRFAARPPTLLKHDIDWVEEALADVLEPEERALAEAEGLKLTWAQMVDLVMTKPE
jgi:predicted ATPase/DNA-binding SARP family transcriptional activator